MSKSVICINNNSNQASLIVGKVYRTQPNEAAEAHNLLRVIDEDKSETDGYLYPVEIFASVDLPKVAEHALMAAENCVQDCRITRFALIRPTVSSGLLMTPCV